MDLSYLTNGIGLSRSEIMIATSRFELLFSRAPDVAAVPVLTRVNCPVHPVWGCGRKDGERGSYARVHLARKPRFL